MFMYLFWWLLCWVICGAVVAFVMRGIAEFEDSVPARRFFLVFVGTPLLAPTESWLPLAAKFMLSWLLPSGDPMFESGAFMAASLLVTVAVLTAVSFLVGSNPALQPTDAPSARRG
jgi:hypothetical protein